MSGPLPYIVELSKTVEEGQFHTVLNWCYNRMGEQRQNFFEEDIPGKWRYFIDTEEEGYPIFFYFAEERAAFEFKMRWG